MYTLYAVLVSCRLQRSGSPRRGPPERALGQLQNGRARGGAAAVAGRKRSVACAQMVWRRRDKAPTSIWRTRSRDRPIDLPMSAIVRASLPLSP